MARINLQGNDLKNWQEGQKMFAADYKKEREIIVTAINDNYDRIKDLEEIVEVDIPQEMLWEANGTQFEFTLTDGRIFPSVSNLLEVSADGIVLAEGDEFEIVNSTTLRLAQGYVQGSQPVSQGTRIYARWYLPKILSSVTDYFNVKDFGAVGNGVSDDTNAIQNTIDKASQDGKQVFIPKGTYNIKFLKLQNNVIIRGEGRLVSVLKHISNTESSKTIYNGKSEVTGSGDVVFRTVIQDISLQLHDDTTVGIEFSKTTMSVLNRVDILGKGANTTAILFDEGDVDSSYYNSLYDVAIFGSGTDGYPSMGTGFKFSNSANSNRLINCRTVNVKTAVDIVTDYTNHILLHGCCFEGFNYGVVIRGDICQIIACRFENSDTLYSSWTNNIPSLKYQNPENSADVRYGAAIVFHATTGKSNTIIGNVITNIAFEHATFTTSLTSLTKTFPDGNMFFNYGRMKTTFLEHDAVGGWADNMSMRNYTIENIGSSIYTQYPITSGGSTIPPSGRGKLAYSKEYPVSGEGLYLCSGTQETWKKVATTLKVPVPPNATQDHWEIGDVVYNSNPVVGGYVGWVLTSGGWKTFGLISN